VLDFCDVEPNPARSKKVRLPSAERAEVDFPSNEEWVAINEHVRKRSHGHQAPPWCGLGVVWR
jgi:hypothetical protein